ncbi:MAG: hypothetical protein AAGM27_09875 [Cyanobacteria bacterium J06554_3]
MKETGVEENKDRQTTAVKNSPSENSSNEHSSDESNSRPSAEDVAGVVAELEQYRARLVEDFMTTAKKAKLPKSMTMAQLKSHPEILKIDQALAELRGESAPETSVVETPAEAQPKA